MARKRKNHKASKNFFKSIFKWCLLLSIWIATFGALAMFYYLHDLPSLADLEAESGKQVIEINYDNGNRITNRGEIYTNKIHYYQLPHNLINAVISTEDRRFFNHHGVDIFGIIRAFYVNHRAGRIVQGGSTITQQLAKMLFLDSNRTLKRKVQEVLLAFQLERNFTKEQILAFYLNRAYFGSGNYGVENAAKNYFGKTVARLNLNECAILAGVLKAPSRYSPKSNLKDSLARAQIVLKGMIDAGYLDEENFFEIVQDANLRANSSQKLYFSDYVYNQYKDFLNKRQEKEKIIKITTTLNEEIQEKIEESLNDFIAKNLKKLGKSQISVIVMAKDGAILGLVGGKDYQESQFNRAIYAKRQSGSAFKSFVYLAAFENGYKINDVFEDKKINLGNWLPDNYNSKYLGEVTLRKAFADSLNSVAIQLSQKVGIAKIAKTARNCGISSKIAKDDSTIALGTSEVSLLELVASYATIANDGRPVIPYSIIKIQDASGNEIYSRSSSGFNSLFAESSIIDIKKALRLVVEEGTGKNADIADNIYGKTGTSQNFQDAWFIGFDDDYVMGVWMGNDDNSPTNKITGGSLPAKLFANIISEM